MPFDIRVERDHRPRQPRPVEAPEDRRGQSREIDLDDLIGAEELVEAAAKMAARLDDHGARPADLEAHHFEEDRVGALHPLRYDDHREAADLQRGAGAKRQPHAGVDAAPPDAIASGQGYDLGRRSPRLGEFGRLRPIELCFEPRAEAASMRLGGQIGVIEDAEKGAVDTRLVERVQQEDRIAAPAAAWIVGDVGKGERRQRRAPARPPCRAVSAKPGNARDWPSHGPRSRRPGPRRRAGRGAP